MFKFNGIGYIVINKFTSRLWSGLHLSLRTNTTKAHKTSVNKVKKGKTSNVIVKTSNENKKFNEFKTKLHYSLCSSPPLIEKIKSAQNVQDLLKIVNTSSLNGKDIENLKEDIERWLNESNTDAQEIEDIVKNEDFSQLSALSTFQMIKVVNHLARKKDRNVSVLRFLFQNIIEYNDTILLPRCIDLLRGMSMLGYSDKRLLEKIVADLMKPQNTKELNSLNVLLSIIQTMVVMRYKNDNCLNHLCYLCRNMCSGTNLDYVTLTNILSSLAWLGFQSNHITDIIQENDKYFTLTNLRDKMWLNFVWSLCIFGTAQPSHLESVLNEEFITNLLPSSKKKSSSLQLKLLNINGYAQSIFAKHSGFFNLNTNILPSFSKQEQELVKTLNDTLKGLMPSESHFMMNVNTKMGFSIDAEVHFNSDFMPVRIDEDNKCTKIAIMLLSYYNTCLGTEQPLGIIKFYKRLLEAQNYKVVYISYKYFDPLDTLNKRVKFLKHVLNVELNKKSV